MLRFSAYVFCFLLLSSFSGGVKEPISDLDKYVLKGKVKSLKETRYYAKIKDTAIIKEAISDNSYASYYILFSESGFITEYHALYPKKSVNTKKIYSYSDGRLTEINEYGADGELKSKQVFEYDKKGNLAEDALYRDGKFFEKHSYSYDDKGRLLMHTYKNVHWKKNKSWNYFYDDTGKKTEVFVYTGRKKKKMSWEEKHLYGYDQSGNLVLDSVVDYPDQFSQKTVYRYDAAGRKTEINNYDNNNSKDWGNTFKYDELGNITELGTFENNGGLKFSDTNYRKYIYDTTGNWIEKTSYDVNLSPTIITERIIEYY